MAFQVHKQHKLGDQLEALAYDWAITDVCEYFGVEEVGELTEEQYNELVEYVDSDKCSEPLVETVLRTMCFQWEDENG